jgi:hypothetical protein
VAKRKLDSVYSTKKSGVFGGSLPKVKRKATVKPDKSRSSAKNKIKIGKWDHYKSEDLRYQDQSKKAKADRLKRHKESIASTKKKFPWMEEDSKRFLKNMTPEQRKKYDKQKRTDTLKDIKKNLDWKAERDKAVKARKNMTPEQRKKHDKGTKRKLDEYNKKAKASIRARDKKKSK